MSLAGLCYRILILTIIQFLVFIFRHTQQFFSYMMAVSFYWWKREPRYILQISWETFSQLHRYEQDSNRRGLEVRGVVVCHRFLNRSVTVVHHLICKKYYNAYSHTKIITIFTMCMQAARLRYRHWRVCMAKKVSLCVCDWLQLITVVTVWSIRQMLLLAHAWRFALFCLQCTSRLIWIL
jgi:hypothetical protein